MRACRTGCLFIGLPLTCSPAPWLAYLMFPGVGWAAAALIAAILAPTDAALDWRSSPTGRCRCESGER